MVSAAGVHSFAAGAASAAALMYLYQTWRADAAPRRTDLTPTADAPRVARDAAPAPAPPAAATELLDSSALDQRMLRKAEGALQKRTSRLILVVERCTNDHNYSAILRTAEALGVQRVYIVAPQNIRATLTQSGDAEGEDAEDAEDDVARMELKRASGPLVKRATDAEKRDRAGHHLFARKATEWLTVTDFEDTKSCIDALRKEGYQIWATDLGQVATCLTAEALGARNPPGGRLVPDKLGIVFGTEAVGCTTEMLAAADLRVYLPLRGFADSLNLSVATALVVHHLFVLDPTLVGAMGEEERGALRKRWFEKLAAQRLLSSRDKKRRGKLTTYLTACDEIERKRAPGRPLQQQSLDKLSKKDAKRAELDAINARLARDAAAAVRDLVAHPPAPLTDLRRADAHRTCFVGKNTKASHGAAWADMPATANLPVVHGATATFFRERVAPRAPAATGPD